MAFYVEYRVFEKGKNARKYELIGGLDPGQKQTIDQIEFFMKNALIEISKDVLTEEIGRGFPRDYRQIVDKRPGKPLSQIKPFGEAIFVAPQNIKDIVFYVWDAIEKRSPVGSGIYKSLNIVTLNGREIAKTRDELRRYFDNPPSPIRNDDRIRFFNEAPYARKLERYGVTANKRRSTFRKSKDKKNRSGPRVRKPSGVYALTYRATKRRFGRNVDVKFEFLPGPEIGRTDALPGKQPDSGSPWRATYSPTGGFNSGYYLYPTIILDIVPGGIRQ